MSELLRIEQTSVQVIDTIHATEEELALTPFLRRAAPDFAYSHGGPVIRKFLDTADAAGHLHDNSLVRSQVSQFVDGAYPTPPQWHFDFVPGVPPETYPSFEEAVNSNSGLIACIFDAEDRPHDTATLVLEGGEIELDMAERDQKNEYVPGKNFSSKTSDGEVYWWDPSVRRQILDNFEIEVRALQPNRVYAYGSHNLHHVPMMRSDTGLRLMARVNTPNDPTLSVAPENKVIKPGEPGFPSYIFTSISPTKWQRILVKGSK